MAGGRFGHSGHDDGSTAGVGTVTRHRLTFERRCAVQEGQRAQDHPQQTNIEHEAMQQRSKLASKQAIAAVQSHEPP
jgi:hypothetical protein